MEPIVKIAVIGASGYTGQELVRLLAMHPRVEIVSVTSRQEAGREITKVFPRLAGAPSVCALTFTEPNIPDIVASGAELAFLALPHGVAAEYAIPLLEAGLKVIDLSADFRLRDAAVYEEFYGQAHPAPSYLAKAVYGLPEVYAKEIAQANLVAAPGCYPTSILLPLLPLLRAGLLQPQSIIANSLSGVSGAGKKADVSLLFAEVNESLRAYGAPKHRHLSEIEQELSLAAGESIRITFIPHLMPITAGIASTITCAPRGDGAEISEKIGTCLRAAYAILGEGRFADTKHVVRTNFIDIGWVFDPRTGRIILTSAEDNLGKGASSQAIQCLNVMRGWPEDCGLLLF
jgi:N-acetyl-gamma-glutamyl-phosphate reductase